MTDQAGRGAESLFRREGLERRVQVRRLLDLPDLRHLCK